MSNNRCYDKAVWDKANALPPVWAHVVHAAGTFDRSRNAEKRDPREARGALIERMARRFRESWKREKRNPAQGRPHGPAPRLDVVAAFVEARRLPGPMELQQNQLTYREMALIHKGVMRAGPVA